MYLHKEYSPWLVGQLAASLLFHLLSKSGPNRSDNVDHSLRYALHLSASCASVYSLSAFRIMSIYF